MISMKGKHYDLPDKFYSALKAHGFTHVKSRNMHEIACFAQRDLLQEYLSSGIKENSVISKVRLVGQYHDHGPDQKAAIDYTTEASIKGEAILFEKNGEVFPKIRTIMNIAHDGCSIVLTENQLYLPPESGVTISGRIQRDTQFLSLSIFERSLLVGMYVVNHAFLYPDLPITVIFGDEHIDDIEEEINYFANWMMDFLKQNPSSKGFHFHIDFDIRRTTKFTDESSEKRSEDKPLIAPDSPLGDLGSFDISEFWSEDSITSPSTPSLISLESVSTPTDQIPKARMLSPTGAESKAAKTFLITEKNSENENKFTINEDKDDKDTMTIDDTFAAASAIRTGAREGSSFVSVPGETSRGAGLFDRSASKGSLASRATILSRTSIQASAPTEASSPSAPTPPGKG